MAAEATQRMSQTVEKELESVDRDVGRPLQQTAFRCMEKCASNRTATTAEVGTCIADCARDVRRFESILQQEVAAFQDRLSRCAMRCDDQVN